MRVNLFLQNETNDVRLSLIDAGADVSDASRAADPPDTATLLTAAAKLLSPDKAYRFVSAVLETTKVLLSAAKGFVSSLFCLVVFDRIVAAVLCLVSFFNNGLRIRVGR